MVQFGNLIKLVAIGPFLLLAACDTVPKKFEPNSTVRVINEEQNLFQMKIDLPPLPNMLVWSYDLPRDNTQVTMKNISKCLEIPEEKRDAAFWDTCGENPIVYDPNIRACLDTSNFNNMLISMKRAEEHIVVLRKRIEAHNERIEKLNMEQENGGSTPPVTNGTAEPKQ